MSIASAFLYPTFYDGLTNVHIVSPPSNIPATSLFNPPTSITDNSRVVIDKVNRLVHIFLNMSGATTITSILANTVLWQYQAFQTPVGNELPSIPIPTTFSGNLEARINILNNSVNVPCDISLVNDGGNINFVNNVLTPPTAIPPTPLVAGNTLLTGTIIYPY
jgi:hypothetical protein